MQKNFLAIGATVLVLASVGIYHIWSNWGLISLSVDRMPVLKVVQKLERLSGKKILTIGTSDARITLAVQRKPLAEVLALVAELSDARSTLVYALSKDPKKIAALKTSLATGTPPEGWSRVGGGMRGGWGGWGGAPQEEPVIQKVSYQAQAESVKSVATQIAFRSDATFLLDQELTPTVTLSLKEASSEAAAQTLARVSQSKIEAIYTLRFFDPLSANPPGIDGAERADWGRRGRRGGPDTTPEELVQMRAEREKYVASLPPEQQARMQELRDFFEKMRTLPPEERRRLIEERMTDPVREKEIDERMKRGLKNRTPEQRHNRWKRMNSRS